MSRCQVNYTKVIKLPALPAYPQLSCTGPDYVIFTESVGLLRYIYRKQFHQLSPQDYLTEIYWNSPRCHRNYYKMEKKGAKLYKIIFMINDAGSYNKLLTTLTNSTFTEIAKRKSEIEIQKGPVIKDVQEEIKKNRFPITFVTDCVLCQNLCSFGEVLAGFHMISSLWGICTACDAQF